MDLKKIVKTTEKYIIKEKSELNELLNDVHRLNTELTSSKTYNTDQFLKKLLKDEDISERICRRLDRLLNKLDKVISKQEKDIPEEERPTLEHIRHVIEASRNKIEKTLGRKGTLHKLIQDKAEFDRITKEIDSAMGDEKDPGISMLLTILHELEDIPTDKVFYIKGLRLPPGCFPYQEWKKFHPDHEAPHELLRWLNHTEPLVFYSTNRAYHELLEECRDHTKGLAKHLQKELDRRGLPVWASRSRLPGSKKHYRKMSFLIRPIHISSGSTHKDTERMQKSEDRDNFMLHYDQDHNLQDVRIWMSREDHNIFMFRMTISSEMTQHKDFFKKHHGNWEKIAAKIADIIEKYKDSIPK